MREHIREEIKKNIAMNKEQYLQLIKKLVSYDSKIINAGEYGEEKGIQDYLKVLFEQMGAEVDAFEPDNQTISGYPGYNPYHKYEGRENVVATFKGNGTGRSLLFNGHCDIVPADNADQWTNSPFECTLRNNKLYGRGTSDMKGGSAAAILAIKLLQDIGFEFGGDIIFESVIDEEGGGNGTIACCDKGYHADGVIIMEPTRMAIMPTNRGAFLAEFTVIGKPIHASMKGYGVNAIEKAFKLIDALKELETEWLLSKKHPLLSNPTINIGQISGGDGASVVPRECTVRFDVEFFPSEYDDNFNSVPVNPELIKEEVENHIRRACDGDKWLSEHPVSINWYQETQCFETDMQSEFLLSVQNTCEEVMGRVDISGLPCGCDGAQLSKIGKMPVLIIGPGDLKQAHTIDESMELDKYYQAIEVYANIIADWAGITQKIGD